MIDAMLGHVPKMEVFKFLAGGRNRQELDVFAICPKKSKRILYGNVLYKMVEDLLDIRSVGAELNVLDRLFAIFPKSLGSFYMITY